MRDAKGKKVELDSAARYYYHNSSQWLVADLKPASDYGILREFSYAVSGMTAELEKSLLGRIDEAIVSGNVAMSRRMRYPGEELEFDREYSWDDLFLDAELIAALREEVEGFFSRRDVYKRLQIPYRRGIMLHGPPGTGKTLVGRIVACTVPHCVFMWVAAADIETARDLKNIFKLTRHFKRCILFFEDLDLYASRREGSSASLLGELLVQMDGMESNDGLLVIATTNDLTAIDSSLKDRPSRFDRLIEIGPAPDEVRLAHLSRLLLPFGAKSEHLAAVCEGASGFTGAQIQELAVVARSRAAAAGRDTITEGDLAEALVAAAKFKSRMVGFRLSDEAADERKLLKTIFGEGG